MKHLVLVILTFISLTAFSQADYRVFPSYETVLHQFYESYSNKRLPENSEIKFEKRPTGWHVTLVDVYSEVGKIKDEIFWDRKKKAFNTLSYQKAESKEANTTIIDNLLRQFDKKYYSISPYFGYPGWDRDVIADYKDATNLPDSTLYALGRAYSSYSSNLLHNNSGLAETSFQFKLGIGKNSMSPEQLDRYRYYKHLAIEKFNEVAKLNPKYETLVGSIGVKAANEYVSGFLELRIFQNEEEANKELVPGLYSDFMISTAKNYLISCAPNAILFTGGDNDTYPLLYVQSQYHFRTDVLVVNLSLLMTDRYINSLRDPILNSKGLPLTITAEEIQDNQRSLLLIESKESREMLLDSIVLFVKDVQNQKLSSNTNYYYFPTNQFKLVHGKKEINWNTSKAYTYLNELIVYDVLSTNAWERPINFAITMGSDYFFGLERYFSLDGHVYLLTDHKKEVMDDNKSYVISSKLYIKLMNEFEWKGIDAITKSESNFSYNYRNMFVRLATALTKENKKDSAIRVLDRCIEIIPNDKIPFDYYFILFVEAYYQLEEFEKGNAIAKQIYTNLKELTSTNDTTDIENKNFAAYGIQYLTNLAQQYKQEKLLLEFKR